MNHQDDNNPLLLEARDCLVGMEYGRCLHMAEQMIASSRPEARGEGYLLRAQLKGYVGDPSILEDARAAADLLPRGSAMPPWGDGFCVDSAGLFSSSSTGKHTVTRYSAVFHQAIALLRPLTDPIGLQHLILRESESCYYQGRFAESMELLLPVYQAADPQSPTGCHMCSSYILLRNLIVSGDLDGIEKILRFLIDTSKKSPYHMQHYNYIMGWFNCFTGWMGETPRFLTAPNGVTHVVLDDRIYFMRNGIAALGRYDKGLQEISSGLSFPISLTRDIYADLFYAVLDFKLGQRKKAVEQFHHMYLLLAHNSLPMPFVEYGRQIFPLLDFAAEQKTPQLSRKWVEGIRKQADSYESSLRALPRDDKPGVRQEPLSRQERQVLQMLMEDYSMAEIARSLNLSVRVVQAVIRGAYGKLGASNRAEAAALLLAQGNSPGADPAHRLSGRGLLH